MIVFAEEIKGMVYAYDENKKNIISRRGKLHNYSDNYIAIKRDLSDIIDVFDSKGKKVYSSNEIIDRKSVV